MGEVLFGDVIDFATDRAPLANATLDSYISTECMLPDFGGVTRASTLPTSGSVTQFRQTDSLFSNIRTYFRKVWFANSDGYCSPDVLVFRSKNSDLIDPNYIFHLARWPKFTEYTVTTSKGAKMPRGDKDAIAKFSFPLPPLLEQRAIASVLCALDDKIALNRRMNETLEGLARALFKDWFVDFGPTRAKASGAKPTLAPETLSLFPDRLDDNGVPEGWSHVPFGKLLTSTIGGDWGKEAKDQQHTEGVSVIRGTDLSTIRSGFRDKVPFRFVKKSKLEKRRLQHGDIVIEVSGGSPTQPTGRSLFVLSSTLERFNNPVVPTSFCRLFRPRDELVASLLSCHLNHLYRSGGTWEYQNQSTGIANFQTKFFLENEQVVIPDPLILKAFSGFVLPLLLRANSNENIALAQTRDLLLPKLMSGALRVGAAEKIVEGAL